MSSGRFASQPRPAAEEIKPIADPRGLALDASGAFVLLQGAGAVTVLRRDATAGAWSALGAGFSSGDARSLWLQGGFLYTCDVANGHLVKIDAANGVKYTCK